VVAINGSPAIDSKPVIPRAVVIISQPFIFAQGCDTKTHCLGSWLITLLQAFTEETVAINVTSLDFSQQLCFIPIIVLIAA
jgi:hypothetical protein